MSTNKQQKVALVTGGSRGIGREIALKLAKEGYYLIVNYFSSQNSAEQLLEEMGEGESRESHQKSLNFTKHIHALTF